MLGHGAREDAPAAFQVDSRLVHAVTERATLLHQGDEAPVQVHDLSGPILQVPLNGPGVRACGLLQAHQKSPGRKRRFTSPEMSAVSDSVFACPGTGCSPHPPSRRCCGTTAATPFRRGRMSTNLTTKALVAVRGPGTSIVVRRIRERTDLGHA